MEVKWRTMTFLGYPLIFNSSSIRNFQNMAIFIEAYDNMRCNVKCERKDAPSWHRSRATTTLYYVYNRLNLLFA